MDGKMGIWKYRCHRKRSVRFYKTRLKGKMKYFKLYSLIKKKYAETGKYPLK